MNSINCFPLLYWPLQKQKNKLFAFRNKHRGEFLQKKMYTL